MTNYDLKISKELLEILKDYTMEMEIDLNEFILDAVVEKFNNENEIFDGDIDINGFIE